MPHKKYNELQNLRDYFLELFFMKRSFSPLLWYFYCKMHHIRVAK